MKPLSETINPSFAKCLKDGIHDAPKGAKYIAVHVSTCHMSVFWETYTTLDEVEKAKGFELYDPQCYSNIKLVWDIEGECLLYYDSIGMMYSAHDQWAELIKNPPKVEVIPAFTPPTHPNIKPDHYCQADPGAPEICYFCGGPVAKVDTSKTTLKVPLNNSNENEEDDDYENEEFDLESCPQCGEDAWDGYICHSCGAKNI